MGDHKATCYDVCCTALQCSVRIICKDYSENTFKKKFGEKNWYVLSKTTFFFLSQIIPPRTNGAGTSSQLLQCSMCLCQIGELMDVVGNRPLLFWRCFPLRLWVTGKSENESKPNTSQISHQNPMETLLWFFFYEGRYSWGFGWLDPLCGHTFYTYTAQMDLFFFRVHFLNYFH